MMTWTSLKAAAIALLFLGSLAGQVPKAPANDPLPGKPNDARADVNTLAPPIHGEELVARARKSLEEGFAWVVAHQNDDGSFGSRILDLAALMNFGFGTVSPGSNDGVRAACTAIVATALLRKPDRNDAEQKALDRAIDNLLDKKKFAYEMGEAFNTWGYIYKLSFLAELLESTEEGERRTAIVAAADVCVDGLKRYQLIDGGWNYYANPHMDGESMSFNTANAISALVRAKREGVKVPGPLIRDAVRILKRMRTRRGGYVYDARFLNDGHSVNELSSAARTVSAAEALWTAAECDRSELLRAVAVFDEGENWLEDGRKLIQPHTAVHQVSGYFFFYGYYFLSELLVALGDEVKLSRIERNAWTMIRTQEADGCWWDTAAAQYGKAWGSGFALLVLQRSLSALEKHAAPLQKKNPPARNWPPFWF